MNFDLDLGNVVESSPFSSGSFSCFVFGMCPPTQGDIDVVKFRRDGRLQEATQPRKVNATMVPYEVGDDSGC